MPRRSFLGYNARMQRRKSIFRWLTGCLLLSMLAGGILGGAGLSVRAAPRQANTLDVIINEVAWTGTAFNSADEWIELYNPGASDIDLTNWQITDNGDINEALSGTIPAGGYYLLERTDDTTVSDVTADFIYTGALTDTGESLFLYDDLSNLIDSANGNGGPWPAGDTVSGVRYSMERINATADSDANWASNDGITRNGVDGATPGNPINGTPKQPNSTRSFYSPLSVIISEVAWAGTPAYFGDEWIELYNPSTTQTIPLDGWILTNTSGSYYISFDISDSIGPGGFFLIEHGSGNATSEPEQKTYTGGSLLSDSGETIFLLAPDRMVVDTANAAGGAWPAGGGANVSSMERVIKSGVIEPDGKFAWITNVGTVRNGLDAAGHDIYGTPGHPNWAFSVEPTFTPTITPSPTPTRTPAPTAALTVVINEVAWAGTLSSSDDEWMELYNPGTNDIDLTGWTLRSSDGTPNITTEFDGITIDAGGYLLLERTDNDPTNVDADVIYTGSLSNTGEILTLYDPNGYIVDTANSNGGAWPAGIAGTYSSMQRSLIATDSDFVWVSYDVTKDTQTKAKDASGNDIYGTPRRANTPINVTPTATPKTTTGGSGGSSSGSTGGTTITPLLAISEFLPRPGYDWNNDGKVDVFDEFIEVVNAGQIAVNLAGYRLDDEANSGSPPYTLPNLTLQPGEHAVFFASESGVHLSDAGDTVRLLRGNKVEDAYTYGVVRFPDQSWCRIPDRLGYWFDPCFPTPNNDNSLTGTIPLPPSSGYQFPVCLLPDTTPEEFVYGECKAGGEGIWNRQYWDQADDAEQLKLGEDQKWEIVLE